MMILPLPTWVVDILIAFNLGISVLLLMVSVYLKSPLEFLAFPSILLLTTLFRLSLSITTTRLILLDADAGKIVETFGEFVVGGNLIVGIVVFLIITIVQFVVITKGSERIAEVGARFSLDGMPGKQMSIDSDMRAGLIDMEQAKIRRENVEKESQLFGSMDGAMKFVKGDAIAGLIIIFVNIIGGMLIGTLQEGMEMGAALNLYAVLTIGEGLVAQIPALIISITAGMIVTRVSTDDSNDMGSDITQQITNKPIALMVSGVLLLLLALVPGLPWQVFLILGGILIGGGYFLYLRSNKAAIGDPDYSPLTADNDGPGASKRSVSHPKDEFNITVPIILEIDEDAEAYFDVSKLNADMIELRRAMYLDLGVPFPGIHVRFSQSVGQNTYRILLNENPVSKVDFIPNHVFIRGHERQNLDDIRVPYEKRREFLPDTETLWVDEKYRDNLEKINVTYMELPRLVTYHLSFILRKYGHMFIGIQETRYLLSKMEDKYSELVKEIQRILPIQKIAEIFQRLVGEDISIRNLRSILEALIEWGQKEKETVLLAEYIRGNLKQYISYKYSNGENILPCYLLDQDLEETIRGSIRQTSAGSYLALEPSITSQFIEGVQRVIGNLAEKPFKPVLLTSMDIRRYVKKLLEVELYDLPVLSYQELTQDIVVQPIDRISIQ
jgi:type III secretion protein V